MAMAAEEAAHEHEHRARFEREVEYIRGRLAAIKDPSEFVDSGLNFNFSDVVHIAKQHLRMPAAEFEAAVSVLNTAVSRVVNDRPSGKDTRDIADWLRMTDEELRLSYSLRTPYDAADFIAHHGSKVGYTAAQIASAKAEYRPLELARLEKRDAEDRARQVAERARIDARVKAGYTVTTYQA
ncbi:hypothetical protein [Sinorhizobium fredii]|uniref:hypothetical protein n=1 Tax=Rhizobium fredii TaxID=380 RepID=UPI0035121911